MNAFDHFTWGLKSIEPKHLQTYYLNHHLESPSQGVLMNFITMPFSSLVSFFFKISQVAQMLPKGTNTIIRLFLR